MFKDFLNSLLIIFSLNNESGNALSLRAIHFADQEYLFFIIVIFILFIVAYYYHSLIKKKLWLHLYHSFKNRGFFREADGLGAIPNNEAGLNNEKKIKYKKNNRFQIMKQWFVHKYVDRFNKIMIMLEILAILFLAIAILRPQWGMKTVLRQIQGHDVIFIVDTSISMTATDVLPSRMEKAKQIIKITAQALQGNRMSIVAFSGDAFVQCPFTTSIESFLLFVQALAPGIISARGSNIELALNTAMKQLSKTNKSIVVLITDGESTAGDDNKALQAMRELNKKNDNLFLTIGIGTKAGALIDIPSQGQRVNYQVRSYLNEAYLKNLANRAGGKYFSTENFILAMESLFSSFQLKFPDSQINQKNLATQKYEKRSVPMERYQIFVFLSMFFLLMAIAYRLFSLRQHTHKYRAQFIYLQRSKFFILFLTFLLLYPGFIQAKANEDYAYKLFKDKKYEESIAFLEKIVYNQKQTGKTDYANLYNLANGFYKIKKYEKAIAYYEKASQTKDLQLQTYILNNHSLILIHLQKKREAFSLLQKALILANENDRKIIQKNLSLLYRENENQKQNNSSDQAKNNSSGDQSEKKQKNSADLDNKSQKDNASSNTQKENKKDNKNADEKNKNGDRENNKLNQSNKEFLKSGQQNKRQGIEDRNNFTQKNRMSRDEARRILEGFGNKALMRQYHSPIKNDGGKEW